MERKPVMSSSSSGGSRPDARGTGGFRGGHAVVIGASMAGLVSARVLAEHFARVARAP
ncbi:MAG TPA: hypothetical protein VL242_31180 [Sorangium sp.]|nr:hypothetical protein [Sorangium sp.]